MFEEPTLEVLQFGEDDVITASGVTPTAPPCNFETPED